ncbi:MAG: PIN domain-containing protein [Gemmatimonadales bacterium]
MAQAFLDTSCVVSMVLDEPGGARIRRRINRFDELVAAGLLEAELQAVLLREGVDLPNPIPAQLTWAIPLRHLGPEIAEVLAAGYLRGADCWHLATALYVAGDDPASLHFLTLDERQATVASALGFAT